MQPNAPGSCPFCRENGLLQGEVLAEAPRGYLIANRSAAGTFLIIPTVHAEEIGELPDDWWQSFKQLFAKVPGAPQDFNVALNRGALAGQSVRHLHFWIVPRHGGEPASGKGLVGLIGDVNKNMRRSYGQGGF